jgi:hypothetical protein
MWYSRERQATRPRTIPCLEQLEERTVLSSSGASGAVVQPPSQFQALVSLAIDGAYLETFNLITGFVTNNGASAGALDIFGIVPSVTTDASARASAAGVNFNTLTSLNQFLGSLRTSGGVNPLQQTMTDIQSNLQVAGPFALFALKAGADAAHQAVQQPVPMMDDDD